MSYRPVVRACATAAFTVLIGVAASTVPASAAESPAASADVLAAVQRDLGLTAAAAEQRLLAEAAAAQQEEQLTAELGDRVTGSWLDGSGRLVVRTADAAAAERVTAAGAVAAAQGRDPKIALDRLNGSANAQGRSAQAAVPASVGAWYVDEAAGVVVVEATNAAEGRQFAARAGDQADLVRVRQVRDRPQPFYNLVGGQAIYAANGGRCSIGFSARQGSTAFVITAGHCTEIGGTWSGYNRVAIGPVAGTAFPGDDMGIIRVNNQTTWVPTSQVQGTSSVLGATVAAIGAATCRSGSTTGYRCGVIQSRNATVNYGGGDIVYGLTRTNACAEPGDSGGSFVAGRQAQGMTSGGSGNCSVGGTTYFQPVQEALTRFGLTLVTG